MGGAARPRAARTRPGRRRALLNDDRVGRGPRPPLRRRPGHADHLDGPGDAVREFAIDLDELHNDSTTVTFPGDYREPPASDPAGTATPGDHLGHNKDHRPDLKQLLYILTVRDDGGVPVHFRVANGNTTDDHPHRDTWDLLCKLSAGRDFLYVADCKLATAENMAHIARPRRTIPHRAAPHPQRGHLVPGLGADPRPDWTEAQRAPERAGATPTGSGTTFEAPAPSADGLPGDLGPLHQPRPPATPGHPGRPDRGRASPRSTPSRARLSSPKTRIKTSVAVEQAAAAALQSAGAERWVGVHRHRDDRGAAYRQENRGRPGAETRYRRTEKTVFTITAAGRHRDVVGYDAVTDGCFPLITNDTTMTDAEALAAYRYQPNLERRNHLLKGAQEVAPVHLREPHTASKRCCCATSWPCSPKRSSSARSAPRWQTAA